MAEEESNDRQERGRGRRRDSGNSVVLGPRDSLIGSLTIEGELTVRGTVEGELHVSGDVNIEHAARVEAIVEAADVNVRGNLTGNVTARGRLLLAGSSVLNGDVVVARLAVEDGARLNGKVMMGETVSDAPGPTGTAEPPAAEGGSPEDEQQG